MEFSQSKSLYCVKCERGYNGVVKGGEINYIESCELMLQCRSNIRATGLPPILQNLVSCYKCTDSTELPFIALDVDYSANSY